MGSFDFIESVVVYKEQLSSVSRDYRLNLVSCKDQLLFKEGRTRMFVRSLEREETRVIDFLEDKKLMFSLVVKGRITVSRELSLSRC